MGTHRGVAAAGARASSATGKVGESTVHERDLVHRQDGRAVARPAGTVRPMEDGAQQVFSMEREQSVRRRVAGLGYRSRSRIIDHRRLVCSRTPAQRGRKRGAEAQCIGRSRGGLTTKVHAIVDALGNPVHVHVTPGNVADVSEASRLIDAARGENFIADKGYDADFVVAQAAAKGMKVVIPPKSNRKNPRPTDFHRYKERHLVENFFCKLKHFRRVATRYEKTALNFLGFLLLASIKIWLV